MKARCPNTSNRRADAPPIPFPTVSTAVSVPRPFFRSTPRSKNKTNVSVSGTQASPVPSMANMRVKGWTSTATSRRRQPMAEESGGGGKFQPREEQAGHLLLPPTFFLSYHLLKETSKVQRLRPC